MRDIDGNRLTPDAPRKRKPERDWLDELQKAWNHATREQRLDFLRSLKASERTDHSLEISPDDELGIKDINGHEIAVGARVYIRPRPSRLAPGSEISGRGGEVARLLEDHPTHGQLIEVLTFPDGGVSVVKASEVAVQYGKSRAHDEFTLQRKACPGPSRRGR